MVSVACSCACPPAQCLVLYILYVIIRVAHVCAQCAELNRHHLCTSLQHPNGESTQGVGWQEAAKQAGDGWLDTELRARMLRLRHKLPRAPEGSAAAAGARAAPAAGPPPAAVAEPHKPALPSTAKVLPWQYTIYHLYIQRIHYDSCALPLPCTLWYLGTSLLGQCTTALSIYRLHTCG